jgi:cytochrome P450
MALLAVLLTVLALPVALIAWTAQSLARNRSRAKATGFPYLVRWVSPINPFWLLYGSSFVRLCSRLGFASKNFTRIYSYGWEANERAKIHLDYGDVFMVAHPGGIQLCVSNAETIHEILQRRADFTRNMEEFAVLNVYGKNLSTTDGQEWQQHRKMTTVTFTEKNDELVWQRSLAQANGILEYWTQRAEQPIRSTHQDTKIFTLNVLAAVLFNKVYPFEGQAEETLERHIGDTSYQYRESLSTILASIIHILIFGEQGLKAWWTPESWKKAAASMASFRAYIFGLMDNERVYITEGKSENQHLVARLVRACEDQLVDDNASISTDKDKSRRMTLTKEEILSNLFVYAFAGNDTTAIALTNIIIHLAANPETQGWISEEINYYLNDDTASWNYGNFSKLKRCAAVVVRRSLISSFYSLYLEKNLIVDRWNLFGYAIPSPNSSKQQIQPPSPSNSPGRPTLSQLRHPYTALSQLYTRTPVTGAPIPSPGTHAASSAPRCPLLHPRPITKPALILSKLRP